MASLKVEKLAERIEYNGEVYEKVTGQAEIGDLVKALRDGLDITAGNFYEVLKSGGEFVYFQDDENDYQGRLKRNYEVYRKVGHKPQKYREVKRAAKVGERIRIVMAEGTGGKYHNGDEFEVINTVSGLAVKVRGLSRVIWHREYVVLEPIEEPKRLQVGDYAKVVSLRTYNGDLRGDVIEIGDIGEIIEIDESNIPYRFKRLADGFITWFNDNGALTTATAEEVAEAQRKHHEASIKPGDYVRVIVDTENLPEGTFGKVTEVDEEVFYTHKVETLDGSNYDLFTVSQLEKIDEQTAKWGAIGRKVGEFKDSDIVRILHDNPCGSRHKKGDIGTVENANTADFEVNTAREGRAGRWVTSDDVELIAPAESVVNLSV